LCKIASQNYGYSEFADKPGPIKESVFHGGEAYKLKYKAARTWLFLFTLCPDDDDSYYSLIR
jgi:hypothetical protein